MKKHLPFLSFCFLASCSSNTLNVTSSFNINKTKTFNKQNVKTVCIQNPINLKNEENLNFNNNFKYKFFINGKMKILEILFPNVIVDESLKEKKIFISFYGDFLSFIKKICYSYKLCYEIKNNYVYIKPACTLSFNTPLLYHILKDKYKASLVSEHTIVSNLSLEDKERLLKLLNDGALKEINYEIKVIEVSKNDLKKIELLRGKGATTSPFFFSVSNDFLLNLENSLSNIKILKTIYLSTIDNKEVSFVIGDEIPYLKKVEILTNSTNIDIDKAVDGFKITLTPKVLNDNLIETKINLEINSVKDIKEFYVENSKFEEVEKYTRNQVVTSLTKAGDIILLGGFDEKKNNSIFSFFTFSKNHSKNAVFILIKPTLTIYKICKILTHKNKVKTKIKKQKKTKNLNSTKKNSFENLFLQNLYKGGEKLPL